MKYILILCLALGGIVTASAQTSKSKTSTTTKPKTTTTTAKKPAPAPVKEVTVTLKSLCERNVAIYAGNKTGLRDPKIKEIGGLSTSKLYLKTYDVVCILGAKNKVMSCIEVKSNTATVEVNESGTVVVAK